MNNREFKFRFWNRIAQRFQPASKYAIDGKGDLVAYDYEMRAYDDAVPFSRTCIVAQQYTGLKDKNGIEIYEGDILHFENQEGVWSDQVDKNIEVKYPFICGNAHLGEIIGNIYEPPELVEQTV
jgi:uncharacterized phage protein (TIGR01671 family)